MYVPILNTKRNLFNKITYRFTYRNTEYKYVVLVIERLREYGLSILYY